MSNPALERLRKAERDNPDHLSDLDRAVLAFARWQGLTGEGDVQRAVAHKTLDALIVGMEPEDWTSLKDFAGVLGEPKVRELLKYSLERSLADLTEKREEVELLPEWPEMERLDQDVVPEKPPTKRRDREP